MKAGAYLELTKPRITSFVVLTTWLGWRFAGRAEARRAARAVQAVVGDREVRILVARTEQRPPRVATWRSPRSASSR